jgi:large subunit ribosomal protein L33
VNYSPAILLCKLCDPYLTDFRVQCYINTTTHYNNQWPIKKNKNMLIKLVSTAGTGYFLVKKRNPKSLTEKLSLRKFDPKARKHVTFKEVKIK